MEFWELFIYRAKITCSQLPRFARKRERFSGKDKWANTSDFCPFENSVWSIFEKFDRILLRRLPTYPGLNRNQVSVVQECLVAGTTRSYYFTTIAAATACWPSLLHPGKIKEAKLNYDLWITKSYLNSSNLLLYFLVALLSCVFLVKSLVAIANYKLRCCSFLQIAELECIPLLYGWAPDYWNLNRMYSSVIQEGSWLHKMNQTKKTFFPSLENWVHVTIY